MDFGIQLFSLPHMLNADLESALQMLNKMGYKELELFGPYPFSVEAAKKEWDSITPMLGFRGSGFFGRSIEEFSALLNDHHLSVPAMHTDLHTLESAMPALAAAAHQLGATYVCLPTTPPELRESLDDYYRLAERFNQIGANAQSHGLKFAYHNHGYGLSEQEGQLPMQILLDHSDPTTVWGELDIYWTTAGGMDPVKLLQAYPNRYHLLHIKDMKEPKRFSGDGGDPSQWLELFPFMANAGEGVLDLAGIVKAAKVAGVQHFIVEHDLVVEPQIALKKSLEYLKSLSE